MSFINYMKDMNMETVSTVVINLPLSTDHLNMYLPDTYNLNGYVGANLLSDDPYKAEYYSTYYDNGPDMTFALILQSIGHAWGLSKTYKTTLNVNLKDILLRVIKYNQRMVKLILTRINNLKALSIFTFEDTQHKIILPIVPIEYQIQSSLRKTSPPLFA